MAVVVSGYFTDPDGDVLTFAAVSPDTAVVSAAVDRDTLRLTGGGTGGAGTVTVTAVDPAGLSALAAVAVTVNRAPVLSGQIPAQVLIDGAPPGELDVAAYFTDPDGDFTPMPLGLVVRTLTFAAASSDTAVVRVALSGTALTLETRTVGEAAVTVTATDPDSLEARAVFTVEVTENLDRAALVALYEATDGPNWRNNENWLTDAPLSEWRGVTFGGGGRVVRLDLSHHDLTGPIPPDLGSLSGLIELDLSYNALTGPIPPKLGNLASLSRLDLYHNRLTGPIPPELGNLAKLKRLNLSGSGFNSNALTGPIPPELGNLASLETLSLYGNALTGPIPPELSKLANLLKLSLFRNDLTGPIPPELGNLASLETLSLYGNALSGPIPPELSSLASLETLSLGGNALTGPVPPELGNLASLKGLGLGSNDLTGPIPPELGNLASLETLSLYGNALTGPIPPELGNLASLKGLSLFDTDLSGPIPPELGNLASLETLNLYGNALLSGPIPPELGNLASLETLNLYSNALSGPIPPELGNLASLHSLHLGWGNALTGSIPPELGNLASLGYLDLSGNALTGSIPPELGNLGSLLQLFLNTNALSGPIPPELGKFAYLWKLSLHSNALTGPIPPELGNLYSLRVLSLGDNALTGPIPPELANLSFSLFLGLDRDKLCVPGDPRLRAWLVKIGFYLRSCIEPGVRPLPLALMREDGNGLSLALPDSLPAPLTVTISDRSVVAATIADGWLVLEPRSIGRADVEVAPSGGGSVAVARVAVRKAVGTFGIDIVMDRPVVPGYEETMVAAADWWSSVLDGTEWEDRRPGCYNDKATAVADELVIRAGVYSGAPGIAASVRSCFWSDGDGPLNPGGGYIRANMSTLGPGDVDVMRHEIGHVLGLVGQTGLTTGDKRYFTGFRAVEVYRAGGGDPGLPGVPMGSGAHWHFDDVGCELMHSFGGCGRRGGSVIDGPDALSLAALADLGFTVDMTKATRWSLSGTAAATMAEEPFRERVEAFIVPRPVPE